MTSVLVVKLCRDLRAAASRVLLMVVAIAVSLTVLGGVLCAWVVVGRETRRAYLSTQPASATILLGRALDAEQMKRLGADARTRPGVIEATGRSQFISQVEVNGRAREIPLQVFVAAPDDPMRMAKFQVLHGRWPPSPQGIYIGRDSLKLLGVELGDAVTLRTPSGAHARLRVAGVVYDPSLAPAPQHQMGHAYLSSAPLSPLAEPALLDQLKIQVAVPGQTTPSRNRESIVSVAGTVARWLERAHGVPVREIQVPEPYAHPHQRQADALLLSLLAGGAAALLLSAILVANMVGGIFAQQIPQIGIMKAIGARSGHVARLYLAMTLVVAASAALLALPPALAMSHVLERVVFGFLGIQPVSLSTPWWAYAMIVAAGLLLPPLMSLGPLVRASCTTVRAAIDHRSAGSNPSAATGLLARLGGGGYIDRRLLMVLRNTLRRPTRSLLSAGLLASACSVFVAGMSLSAGVKAVADEAKARRNWDVDVQLAGPAPQRLVTSLAERVPHVRRIEGWRTVSAGVAGPGQLPVTRTYPDQGHGGVFLTVIPPGAALFARPPLL